MRHVAERSGGHGRVPAWRRLHVQVFAGIALGILIGALAPAAGVALKPLGDGFVKLVRMIVAPVIFCSVAGGLARSRDLGEVGRVTAKALGYFLTLSTFALVLGLVVGNLVQPGAGMAVRLETLDAKAVADYAGTAHHLTLTGFVLDVIPKTFASALTEGSILQVLFVALLFGVGVAKSRAESMARLLDETTAIVFRIVDLLMWAAPWGAMGAMAFTVGKFGVGTLVNLGELLASFYATSALFVLVVLGLVARVAGFSLLRLLAYLKAELLVVLGTSSSEAALPSLMEKLEAAGCDEAVVGLVVPTGYSFNLDGTNIYITLAALFIAQATGTHLGFADQALLLGVAMISSKGAAGVTGAGFVTLAATLSVVPSLPLAGIGLIVGIDRLMSQCRSLTNFIGNAVATVVVASWEKQLDRVKLDAALRGESP